MSEQTVHFLRDYDQLAEDALQLGCRLRGLDRVAVCHLKR